MRRLVEECEAEEKERWPLEVRYEVSDQGVVILDGKESERTTVVRHFLNTFESGWESGRRRQVSELTFDDSKNEDEEEVDNFQQD